MIDTETLYFLIIIISAILIGGYIIHKFHASSLKKFELTITYFGGISVFLIIYSIYLSILTNNMTEKNRLAYNTLQNIEQNFLTPQRELLTFYPEGFFLYASMNPETNLSELEPKTFDPAKRNQTEVYYSIRIFQAIEDFLSTAAYDLTGQYVWLNSFLMWMQSPILQKNWKLLSFNFSIDTRTLIDKIIQESNKLNIMRIKKGSLNSSDYDAISSKLNVLSR